MNHANNDGIMVEASVINAGGRLHTKEEIEALEFDCVMAASV